MFRSVWQKYVVKDFMLKAFSVLVALLLWLAVSYLGESTMSISVRLTVKGLPESLMVKKMEPEYVFVILNGPVSRLKDMKPQDVKAIIDLSSFLEGVHSYNIQKKNIIIPRGLRLESVRPTNTVIEIDHLVEKHLKVSVVLDKRWKDSYYIKTYYPKYVTIKGSEKALKNVGTVQTVPVMGGSLLLDEEELDIPLDLKKIDYSSVRPEIIRVVLRRK